MGQVFDHFWLSRYLISRSFFLSLNVHFPIFSPVPLFCKSICPIFPLVRGYLYDILKKGIRQWYSWAVDSTGCRKFVGCTLFCALYLYLRPTQKVACPPRKEEQSKLSPPECGSWQRAECRGSRGKTRRRRRASWPCRGTGCASGPPRTSWEHTGMCFEDVFKSCQWRLSILG